MSAIGSVSKTPPRATNHPGYQLDFEMPGISPRRASSRKQIRHSANLRMNARGRPQRPQRLCFWVENLGGRSALAIDDFLAILFSLRRGPLERHPEQLQETFGLLIRARAGHYRDLQPPNPVNLVVVDLGEDKLLAHAHRVIPPPVKSFIRHSAKVTDTRQGNRDEAVDEFVHAL